MRVPAEAGLGVAKVSMTFAAWKEGKVAPGEGEIRVVDAPKGAQPVARPSTATSVSPKLKGSLVHPNKGAVLTGLRFSPDGARIIAGDYPNGMLIVWDAVTGKRLTRIETGYGLRVTQDYFFPSPDWKTVYVHQEQRKTAPAEKAEKKVSRLEFDGDVRSWGLDTGRLRTTFKHNPPRGIYAMMLSPDGSKFVTFEQFADEAEGRLKITTSVWDTQTGQNRTLSDRLTVSSVFAPDGRTLAAACFNDQRRRTAVEICDVSTGKVNVSIPITPQGAEVGWLAYSPDGKTLVGQTLQPGYDWLKLWDAATGEEVASIEGDKNDYFSLMAFSPDGRTLAISNSRSPATLSFVDVANRKLLKKIIVAEKEHLSALAFSPDGKLIVAATQNVVYVPGQPQMSDADLPQARIHLVDATGQKVRETIVAPQGILASVCFSPDGKTLASGGHGRVLLWDLTEAGSAQR